MKLPSDLLDEFAKVTHDPQIIKENTTFYGTAKFNSEGDFVLIDGATTLTPATFATNANDGDRVIGTIKNHRAIVTANVTNPAMTLGVLKATTGVIVEGYLTTNAKRTKYDDQTRNGLTFSAGGMGANGGAGHYWYITNAGEFHAEDAYVKGKIIASSGYIGDEESGFTIDKYGIFSGTKSGVNDGFITLGNQDFKRAIGGKERELLRFAIGANFGVTAKGELYANSANITGEITATSGKIGNFDINGALYSNNKKTIDSSNPGVYLGDQGIALGADSKFKVTSEGVLTAKEATINGVLTAKANSKIGPWNVSDSSIWKGANEYNNANSLYFGDDGLSIKQNFLVTSTGSLTAKAGKIGNWTIGNSTNEKNGSLWSGTFGKDDSIFLIPGGTTAAAKIGGRDVAGTDWVLTCGSNFGVTKNGDVYANNGKFGPLYITKDKLYTGTKDGNGIEIAYGKVKSIGTDDYYFRAINGSHASILEPNYFVVGSTLDNAPSLLFNGTSFQAVCEIDAFQALNCYSTASVSSVIYGGSAIGSGGKMSWNDTDNNGCWITSTGQIHLTESTSSGGTIGFHYYDSTNGQYFASATSTISENEKGQIRVSGKLVTGGAFTSGGNVAINGTNAIISKETLTPIFYKLKNSKHEGSLYVSDSSDGNFGLYSNTNSDWIIKMNASGKTIINGYTSSDIRLKKNIKDSSVNALGVLNRIHVREFDWKDEGREEYPHWPIGIVVDELEKLDPRFSIGGGSDDFGSPCYKSVNTFYLIGYLLKAIQELSTEVNDLKADITAIRIA